MTAHVGPPTVGATAPPLRLMDITGREFDLLDIRGQPVLISFLRHAG